MRYQCVSDFENSVNVTVIWLLKEEFVTKR